jgi:hypothetical protein
VRRHSPGTLRGVTSPPSFGNDWTTPPPPHVPGSEELRPIHGRRVGLGIILAVAAHLVTVGVAAAMGQLESGPDWLLVWALGQLVLLVAAVTAGTILLVRGDRGVGLGVFIGWGGGLVLTPLITIAVILLLIRTYGVG